MRFLTVFLAILLWTCFTKAQTMVGLSFDDPSTKPSPNGIWQERNIKILQTLQRHELKAALFVCGMRIDSPDGKALLQSWNDTGHMLCSHSYSHSYFAGKKVSARDFERELVQTDSILRRFPQFKPYFRFPYLKEGATAERRDSMRQILALHGYQNGHVGIDASDWYVDQLLCDSLQKNPLLNPAPFRDFYVAHITARAAYYDSLATAIAGHKVRLVLLLHHNLINALFLNDMIQSLQASGWVFVDANYAYQDPVYQQVSDALPAGESLIWSLAKATGKYDDVLRYPAEDSEYEAPKWQAFLQQYRR